MMFRMQALQPLTRNMRVNLRRGQVRMPEQHLHHAQIGAVVQQVRRKRMAQRVRRQRGLDVRNTCIALDVVPERLARQGFDAVAGEQYWRRLALGEIRAAFGDEAVNPSNRLLAQRHQTFLVALADDTHNTFYKVYLRRQQTYQFRDAQASGVEHFEHGAVAQATRLGDVRRVQQLHDLFFRERLRQWTTEFRGLDERRGVGIHHLFANQIAVKPSQTGKQPRGGARARAFVDAVFEIAEKIGTGHADEYRAARGEPLRQTFEIAPVSVERIPAQALFEPDHVVETFDERLIGLVHA